MILIYLYLLPNVCLTKNLDTGPQTPQLYAVKHIWLSLAVLVYARPEVKLACAVIAACWAGAMGDALMAAAVMLWVGRQMAAAGTLVGAHRAPLRKIALSLGAGCGLAGYFIIRRVGGNAERCDLSTAVFP